MRHPANSVAGLRENQTLVQSMKTIIPVLAPLPPSIWVHPPVRHLPFPLGRSDCQLVARARHGLWHGVRSAGMRPGDEVLAPAYHHGSEVEALIRAGLTCRFYEATETLEPDEGELLGLLGSRTRALHLTHHLGFPQDAARWRRWCDERGLLLIEDAAQAWLAERHGRPVGSDGDLAIYCLYKTFGLPDGAAVLSRAPVVMRAQARRFAFASLGLEHGLWLVSRSHLLSLVAERAHRERAYDPSGDFALGHAETAPSIATLLVLPRVADATAAERRRRNYRRLQSDLGALIPAPFKELPPGASPFVFPVASEDKRGLLRHVRAQGIRALDLWSVPHPALSVAEFPGARSLRARVIGLPVHQELRDQDLATIVSAVRDAT